MDIDRPRSVPSVVQNVRCQRIRPLRNLTHRAALMTLCDELQSIAQGPFREGFEYSLGEWRGDGLRKGFRGVRVISWAQLTEHKSDGVETSEGVEVVQRKRSDGRDHHQPTANLHN